MKLEEITWNRQAAMSNRGNQARIKQMFRRARAGEKLTIGFIGGSITQGSVATKPTLCYAYHVFEWWEKTFPTAKFTYVNAGIGATDSQFGCARVDTDLLQYRPDFVIIEFSVNDAGNAHFQETYEGLVRKIYGNEKKPAVLLVHNVCYDNGSNAQLIHSKVGRYYDLPAVSMQATIYPELLAGRLENRAITPDDLHPNDLGHQLVASVITSVLDTMLEEVAQEEPEPVFPMTPMTANGYEHSIRYRNDCCEPICFGFQADGSPQEQITDIFKKGWTATEKGATIRFEVEGASIAIQYRKTIQLPAPVAEVILDGDEEHPFMLDANFDETWGDKLVLDTILDHGVNKKHTVEVRLTETHPQDKLPFYLVSVIGSC